MERSQLVAAVAALARSLSLIRARLASFPFDPPAHSAQPDRICARWSCLWHARTSPGRHA
ncbi:MAG TPA: hypothetical protein VG710_11860 [Opitutus sp.]|nr:hypothetical protein [Opitutus sp.]